MKGPQIKLLHAYPTLAGLTDDERRTILLDVAGCYSSKELRSQAKFEEVMAIYEAILWERVELGTVADPRACRKCDDHPTLAHVGQGWGQCPVCNTRRKVIAWTPDYWAKRVPGPGQVNSRVRHRLHKLWTLLVDYLPPSEKTDRYLAGIMAHAAKTKADAYLTPHAHINWSGVPQGVALSTIEALKDRLVHAVGKAA